MIGRRRIPDAALWSSLFLGLPSAAGGSRTLATNQSLLGRKGGEISLSPERIVRRPLARIGCIFSALRWILSAFCGISTVFSSAPAPKL
jgi:hypothetical protein